MIRHGVKPYLFVINNDGYEIERQIHGWTAKYNDIQLYDHQMLLPFLAGKKSKVSTEHPFRFKAYNGDPRILSLILISPSPRQVPYESIAVHTPSELEALLTNEAFAKDDKIRLVEVYMPRGDAPEGLIRQAKLTAEANEKASEE